MTIPYNTSSIKQQQVMSQFSAPSSPLAKLTAKQWIHFNWRWRL